MGRNLDDLVIKLNFDGKSYLAGLDTAHAGTRRLVDSMAQQVGRAGTAVDALSMHFGRMGHAAIGALGVRQIASAADAWTNLTARVAIASDGLGRSAVAQAQVYDIAQRTRQPLDGIADAYVKVASAGRELGLRQTDVARTTETLAKSMALGGGSAESQKAALIQFGQALGSGALRGEELNSVLEQAPALAKLLADSLGVPVGKLKELAEQGRLTSDVLVNALLAGAQRIDEQFARLPVTIGQSLATLGNSFMRTIGLVDEAGGASAKAAGLITKVGDNMGATLSIGAAGFAAWQLYSRSAAVAALATGAATAAIGALGGPVTAVAALLGVGASAWLAWKMTGTDAEKAVERQVVESDAEIIARIRGQIAAIDERNRKARETAPEPRDARAADAGAAYARIETRRQKALRREGEFAHMAQPALEAIVGVLTAQAGQAWDAYIGAAAMAADKARAAQDKIVADAATTAALDIDIKRKWALDATKLATEYTKAIELAAGDPARIAELQRERDQRLIEGQRRTNEALQSAADARSAKARALQEATLSRELQRAAAASAQRLRGIDLEQAAVEARQRLGLSSVTEYENARLGVLRKEVAERSALIRQEIEAEKKRPAKDPTAAVQKSKNLLALQGRLDAEQGRIPAAENDAAARIEQAAVDQSRDRAREWASAWQQADQTVRQLQDQTAVARAQALTDPLARETELTRLQVEELRRAERALLDGLRAARDQAPTAGAAAEIEAQIRRVTDATAAAVAQAHADLAERVKPGWQKLLDGWSDVQADMRQRSDDFHTGWLAESRDVFEQWVTTGKLSARSLVQYIQAQFARMAYERFLAAPMAQLGSSIFDALFGSSLAIDTGGSGIPADIPGNPLDRRAAGGPVRPGRTYLVGERGPELLRMGQSGGDIVPNHRLPQLLGLAGRASPRVPRLVDRLRARPVEPAIEGDLRAVAAAAGITLQKSAPVSSRGSDSRQRPGTDPLGFENLPGWFRSVGAGALPEPPAAAPPDDPAADAPSPRRRAALRTLVAELADEPPRRRRRIQVEEFAAGGIFDSATPFEYGRAGQRRLGVLGEAGPEAVLPLERGSDGRLGLAVPRQAAESGQGMTVHLNIAPVFHGGVSRNELMNGMALATEAAVARLAELRARGHRAYVEG